jgi:hypothetical protein
MNCFTVYSQNYVTFQSYLCISIYINLTKLFLQKTNKNVQFQNPYFISCNTAIITVTGTVVPFNQIIDETS